MTPESDARQRRQNDAGMRASRLGAPVDRDRHRPSASRRYAKPPHQSSLQFPRTAPPVQARPLEMKIACRLRPSGRPSRPVVYLSAARQRPEVCSSPEEEQKPERRTRPGMRPIEVPGTSSKRSRPGSAKSSTAAAAASTGPPEPVLRAGLVAGRRRRPGICAILRGARGGAEASRTSGSATESRAMSAGGGARGLVGGQSCCRPAAPFVQRWRTAPLDDRAPPAARRARRTPPRARRGGGGGYRSACPRALARPWATLRPRRRRRHRKAAPGERFARAVGRSAVRVCQ